MPQHESADYLPSDSGQNTSMPPNIGAAHPLGPFAPRPCGAMASSAGDNEWLPSPSGQLPGSVNYDAAGHGAPGGKSSPAPKGDSSDAVYQKPGNPGV